MSLAELSAAEAARRIRAGEVRSRDLVQACLDRIDEIEPKVRAWRFIDPDHALAQARAADEARQAGEATGRLHGVPVGVKDIYDTADLPTENGSPLHAGRRPNADSAAVSRLREAGAVIMGKTVTTEFALYGPGPTANPHDPERTPGGSSSGSAAAVAACMVPAALGSQTNGSVIRPASFCGVFGYKPTFGRISRRGVLPLSRPLDTMGVFARSIEDLALTAEALMGFDDRDPDTRPHARPGLVAAAMDEPPVTPRLVFVKTPVWGQAEEDAQQAFAGLVEALGADVEEAALPPLFDGVVDWHKTVMCADLAKNLAVEYESGRDRMSAGLRELIEHGRHCLALDYNRAVEGIAALNSGLDELFERFDAILTPGAPGEAPRGLDATGNPIFCTLWTFCGVPAVSLPLLQGANGMPIGVQLVGRRGDDARLLRTARWLQARVEA